LDATLRAAAFLGFYIYFAAQRASAIAQSYLISPDRFNDYFAYYRLQELNDLPKNQLYLYSERDTIIAHEYVDRFIEGQEKSGAAVRRKRWADSHHVSHMKKHPEEYSRLCVEFVRDVLKG
jgi:hypothetical protein